MGVQQTQLKIFLIHAHRNTHSLSLSHTQILPDGELTKECGAYEKHVLESWTGGKVASHAHTQSTMGSRHRLSPLQSRKDAKSSEDLPAAHSPLIRRARQTWDPSLVFLIVTPPTLLHPLETVSWASLQKERVVRGKSGVLLRW